MVHHKNPEKLPPTKDALTLHIKEAHLQAYKSNMELLLPECYGWQNDNGKFEPT